MNTTFNLSAIAIAGALKCPPANVERYWPALQAACVENGLTDKASVIAVLATVGTEVASFEPISEIRTPATAPATTAAASSSSPAG